MHNHSERQVFEKVLKEPTDDKPGRVRSLHATKGWRETRLDPINLETTAAKLYDAFRSIRVRTPSPKNRVRKHRVRFDVRRAWQNLPPSADTRQQRHARQRAEAKAQKRGRHS